MSGVLKYRTAMALISPTVRALTGPPAPLSFATADGALSVRAATASELLADFSVDTHGYHINQSATVSYT